MSAVILLSLAIAYSFNSIHPIQDIPALFSHPLLFAVSLNTNLPRALVLPPKPTTWSEAGSRGAVLRIRATRAPRYLFLLVNKHGIDSHHNSQIDKLRNKVVVVMTGVLGIGLEHGGQRVPLLPGSLNG
ncbi:hypothetical protein JAAARDRAFT_70755, partial [Jaapia argillacea MUCL 33604]